MGIETGSLIGTSLGRYQLTKRLGEGGFAEVYLARDIKLGVDVAIKFVRMEKLTPDRRTVILARFEQEAQKTAMFNHPNIIKVMDVGEYEGRPYLVMPYLVGGTLKGLIRGPMDWRQALGLLLPIAHALEYVHKRGFLHRDIKPGNILITEDGQPMLTDFGVAKDMSREETMDWTSAGASIGTAGYMPLEQWKGETVPQSDQYALGMVLYELLTGVKPFDAKTPPEILIKQTEGRMVGLDKLVSNLPPKLLLVVQKATAREPKDRYRRMGDFARDMEELLGSRAPKGLDWKFSEKLNWSWLTGAGMALGLMLIFGMWMSGRVGNAAPQAVDLLHIMTSIKVVNATQEVENEAVFENTTQSTNMQTSTKVPDKTPALTSTPVLGIGSKMEGIDGMTLLYVPAGVFTMGTDESLYDTQFNYGPVHQVYLDAYWVDETEVTNDMYAKCVGDGVCVKPVNTSSYTYLSYYGNPSYDRYPVLYVDWNMAKAYCEWAGRRLPSEAEWEKAARGTDGRSYPWGDDFMGLQYVSNLQNEVGSYPAGRSVYGAYDMAGNVMEWVNDWYDNIYYQKSPYKNPQGPTTGKYRVVRSSASTAHEIHIALRHWYVPTFTSNVLGFRCALGESQ